MDRNWGILKSSINTDDNRDDIFLSLIDKEGTIFCANENMIKTLHLPDLQTSKISLFDFLHPANYHHLKSALDYSDKNNTPYFMELGLKNGYYHPMKWQISRLYENTTEPTYLCIGEKILDEKRLKQFTQLGEKNYQLIIEGLNTGILFQDKKGELIAANQKAAEIFGATLERLYALENIEVFWNSIWTIISEKGDRIFFQNTPFIKALKTGVLQEELMGVYLKTGVIRWIHFSSQPLFENNESVPFSVVTSIADVTEQKKLSGELQQREALFNAFMSQSSNPAWVIDIEGNLVFANKSFCQFYEIDESKIRNEKFTDLLPSAVVNVLYERHQKVLESGSPIESVEKVKWADGSDFVFHVNIFPIEGLNGKKLVGGHAVNLAAKYEIEKRLREANDRLLLLSRTTTDAIWEWDMQTGQIFRNDALMDMIGYQIEKAKGLSWWLRRIHAEDRNRVADTIKHAIDRGQHSWEEEYKFKCADNTYKHIHDRGYVVYENGLPVKMIGSLQDVTGVKGLESQLTEEKLQRQKEMSETVIRVQEQERTKIGHELHDNVNQILSTVKLFVDMLTPANKEESKIKAKSLEYVMMAIEEIRKLSKELVVPQLQGEGLVKNIYTIIDDIHLSNSIKIRFTHDHENDLLTSGKKVTLFRIVQEQIKNILNHSSAKNVDIYLQSKDGDTQLIIKDDGVGFNSKQTPRGIGLSNIYERTRFYNGSVDVQTSPGNGCTMTVTMPSFQ